MKNWMSYVMIVGLTAGTASAAWWPFGGDKEEKPVPPPAAMEPAGEHQRPPMEPEQMDRAKARKDARFSPEQMEKMRAQHQELMKLGEAARNATDPAQKDALVAQIRTKLNEIADDMRADGQKRLEQAEKQLAKLKERMAEGEKNRDARIEEQLQRILSGEPLKGPDGKRPEGALRKDGKKGEGKKGPKPVEE